MTNENETPELLPCPFCGSSEVDPNGWYRMTDKVFGSGCVEFGPACDECGSIARTVAAWNTRADLADAKDKRMSDNLVEKARHNVLADMPHYASVELIEAMADRIEELEAENRELHMQVIASDGQAQMAYEEQERIEELEGQLKMVLDRESATHLRHDAKTDKLEALIVELEAKLARVIEIANLIAGRMMK